MAGPIETSLRSSPAIDEAIVFGASKPALGVLIIPSSVNGSASKEGILEAIRELNKTGASHQEIMDEMVIILSRDTIVPKASKGTVLRPKALEKFCDRIDEAYTRLERGGLVAEDALVEDDDLLEYVRDAVKQNLPDGVVQIGDEEDLFVAGITSLKASRVRGMLQRVRQYSIMFFIMVIYTHHFTDITYGYNTSTSKCSV